MSRSILFVLLLSSACAVNTGSPHSAAEYPTDVKLEAESVELSVIDPRNAKDVPDGTDSLTFPSAFQADASARLQRILSKKGLAFKVDVAVVRSDAQKVDTQQGPKLHIEVVLKFELKGPDNTVVKHGRGQSWAEIPEAQISDASVTETLQSTALNAFDQYWADEDTLQAINENIAVYRERRGF